MASETASPPSSQLRLLLLHIFRSSLKQSQSVKVTFQIQFLHLLFPAGPLFHLASRLAMYAKCLYGVEESGVTAFPCSQGQHYPESLTSPNMYNGIQPTHSWRGCPGALTLASSCQCFWLMPPCWSGFLRFLLILLFENSKNPHKAILIFKLASGFIRLDLAREIEAASNVEEMALGKMSQYPWVAPY